METINKRKAAKASVYFEYCRDFSMVLLLGGCMASVAHAQDAESISTAQVQDAETVLAEQAQDAEPVLTETPSKFSQIKQKIQQVFNPEESEPTYNQVKLSDFDQIEATQPLPVIGVPTSPVQPIAEGATISSLTLKTVENTKLTLNQAVQMAIQQHPDISQAIATLASQNANIDVAKAEYYPQVSGGIATGDMTTGERGRQLLQLNATQMLYDFGKVKSSVDTQEAGLKQQQAQVLVDIDDISLQTASAVINVKRYQELIVIAKQQIEGLKKIAQIAELRAKAGISSQADPTQAKAYVESAESTLIDQQTQLALYQQRLGSLLGMNATNKIWEIPDSLVKASRIYDDPEFNTIPSMLLAQAEVNVAKAQKRQTDLSRYPTINVVGSLSQAVNGVNPNNNKDNGLYSSVMFEATSNFYQGGAISAQSRAASYAEEAAKSRLKSSYIDTMDQIQQSQEQIQQKQRQIVVLNSRQITSIKTKELYQEQYKLGTRSVVDLLNAEQAIHTSNMTLVSARYDIYSSLAQYIAATGRTREVYDLNNMSIQGFEVQQ